MNNWTMKELMDYRHYVCTKAVEIEDGMRWYQSRSTRKIQRDVLKNLENEFKKVTVEISNRTLEKNS